jgi:acyl carrier protein
MELKQQVRDFVTANFYVADPSSLEDHASLLDHGIIDSTGVLEVIAFVETTFGVTVEDSEMLVENLGSIERIAAFVACKTSELLTTTDADSLQAAD